MENRTFILELLDKHKTTDEAEKSMLAETIKFVENNVDCFENTFELGHITGSAFIVDKNREQTLLTHHKKLEKWLQFGGHSDGHWNPLEVAWREAEEESGLKSLAYFPDHESIFDIDIHTIPARNEMPEHKHYDIRILLQADLKEPFAVSDESYDLQWVPLENIANYNSTECIQRMVDKVKLL